MNQEVADILRAHGADPATFTQSPDLPDVVTGLLPSGRAAEAWVALRDRFAATGLWPILRGEPDDFDAEPVDLGETLAAVPAGPIPSFLRPRVEQLCETLGHMGVTASPSEDWVSLAGRVDDAGIHSMSWAARPKEPWPASKVVPAGPPSLVAVRGHGAVPPPQVLLALLRIDEPYHAPAALGFGGWNDAPDPAIQVAAMREWHDRYGAVPAAITNDVLECVVARPPQDEAASFQLAAEQFVFCEDIVGQGTQSVRNLAIELWKSPQWFFWWD